MLYDRYIPLGFLNHKHLKRGELSSIPFDYREFEYDSPRFLFCK